MDDPQDRQVEVAAARVGRPRSSHRTYQPQDLVRVEVRMPANVAAALYERAAQTHAPVGRTAADLLAHALLSHEGAGSASVDTTTF